MDRCVGVNEHALGGKALRAVAGDGVAGDRWWCLGDRDAQAGSGSCAGRRLFQQVRRKTVPQRIGMDVLILEPALIAACWEAVQTFVVTGRRAVCHLLPGNSQSLGYLRSPRQ